MPHSCLIPVSNPNGYGSPSAIVPELATSEITFQPSTSISAGQLVCITQDYEPTANGTPRVGPALAVGRMDLPSDLVEGGTKGKALTLLHAWKDRLWEIGGEERPPRPRLLQDSPNDEDDTDEEWTDERAHAAAEAQHQTPGNGDTPRELSREGTHFRRVNYGRY